MRAALAKLRAFYGARPLHLLAVLVSFAIAGYVAQLIADYPALPAVLVWFVAAAVAHDLVLFPLYALADRSLRTGLRAAMRPTRRPARRTAPPPVPVLNHVRIPAMACGLALLLFFPGILQLGAETHAAATGQTQQGFAARWLLLTATLFAASAVLYAVRLARTARRG